MDKKLLVIETQKVIESFAKEAKIFDLVYLEPVHGSETSYVLNLKANWVYELPSLYEAIDLVVQKLVVVMAKDYFKAIHRIHFIGANENLQYAAELVVENKASIAGERTYAMAA